jgi:hypothetical protein
MKAKKMQYGGVKKMQKGGSKLISTVKGTSAINTKLNPKKIIESGFNYNTELAKKQKANKVAADKKSADKKIADKKAADKKKADDAKKKNGKEVKAVVESLIRPKKPIVKKPDEKKPDLKNPVVVKPPAKTVSEIWKEKTGTSWSEAKKQGLTDGSMKANLALLAKLKSGTYDKKPAATVTPTPVPTPTPVVTTTTSETKMKPKGTPTGGSGIGAMERMEREEGMYKRGGSVRKKMMSKKTKKK